MILTRKQSKQVLDGKIQAITEIKEPVGIVIPSSDPGINHCGTHGSGWINEDTVEKRRLWKHVSLDLKIFVFAEK